MGLYGLLWRRLPPAGGSEGDALLSSLLSPRLPPSPLNTCSFSALTLFPGWGLDPGVVPGGGELGQEEPVSGGGGAHADGVSLTCHPLQTCGAKEDKQE